MENKICYLIDDDDDDREIFGTALANIDEAICFMSAASAIEALQRLEDQDNFTPDYIFIDLHMPVVDGKQCLSQIKKMNRFKNVPVVIYSTSISPKDIDDARRLGAAGYISKPYKIQNLQEFLQSFFLKYQFNSESHER
jgi:CheY-like chemotaxis protein